MEDKSTTVQPAIGRAKPLSVHVGMSQPIGTAGPPTPPPDDFWTIFDKIIKLDRIAEILADLVRVFFRSSSPVSR